MAIWGSLAGPSWVDQENEQAAVEAAALAAAARTKRSVLGEQEPDQWGALAPRARKEGTATRVLEGIGHIPIGILGAAGGMMQHNLNALNEQFPAQSGITSVSTDYDPRRMAGTLAGETATNVIGLPGIMGGAPATLASGAIRRTRDLPMAYPEVMERAKAQGWDLPWYHGGERMDRFTESGKIDPRRATSGPMPFFTDNPAVASGYASGKKADTSLMAGDPGDSVRNYFTVDPKAIWPGSRQRAPLTVEQSWNFLPPEVKRDISERAPRIGYANRDMGDGPFTLHAAGEHGGPSSADHWAYTLNREARGNPLAALRDLWHDSGNLVNDPGALAEIYRLAGYPHPISEARAPWTEARGIFPAALRMRNPLVTENTDLLTKEILPSLAQEFKRDRTRLNPHGVDMWAKDTRWTPRDWVANAQEEIGKGANPYVFTSIPDKITGALERRGYDGILDTGGKSTPDYGHRVAIPFRPDQVRSIWGRFDPANKDSGFLLGANSTDKKTGAAIVVGQHAGEAFGSLAPKTAPPVEDFMKRWDARGVRNYVAEQSAAHGGHIKLHDLVVPKDQRGGGIGTEFMTDLTRMADDAGKTVVLTAAKDYGATSVNRLKEFYKRHGFVENKGRNKDFRISDNMYRKPKDGGTTLGANATDRKTGAAILAADQQRAGGFGSLAPGGDQ